MTQSLAIAAILLCTFAISPQLAHSANKRIANKCWNTKLSNADQQLCSSCNQSVSEIFAESCQNELAEYEMLSDSLMKANDDNFDERYFAWQEALNNRDNCKTALINSCFESVNR